MMKNIALLAVVALSLGACSSWFDSNQPYLQSSSNLIPGEKVVVSDKTTAYALAKKHKVPMNDLIVLNRLPSPFVIWPGQEITLPATMPRAGNLPGVGIRGSNFTTAQKQSNAVTVSELPPIYNSQPQAAQIRAEPQQALAPESAAVRFIWPVSGPILTAFGPRNSGGSNDGINIAAPRGTPVMAAGNGVVLHASNETKAYGNLVLIRHGEGYITAYAHLDRMIVDKDSVIAKGDMIGTVGSTGAVKGPQLHFQVRYKGKSVNPLPLLPPHAEPDPY